MSADAPAPARAPAHTPALALGRAAALGLALCLALAGCGGDEPPPPAITYAPLHFDYLTKLRFNVGAVMVEDHSVPFGPADIAAQSPAPPAQALAEMARARIFPAGTAGQAVFSIDQASVVQSPNGQLDGQLLVHLDIVNAAGARVGYAAARVARSRPPQPTPENRGDVLYGMTKDMLDAMNVELEFQVRKGLADWLVTDAAVPARVQAAPLEGAPQPAPPAAPAPGLANPVPDPASPYGVPAPGTTPDAAPPLQMSPPPGYLHLPGAPPPP